MTNAEDIVGHRFKEFSETLVDELTDFFTSFRLRERRWPAHTFGLGSARPSATMRPFHRFNVRRGFIHTAFHFLVAGDSKIPRLLPSLQKDESFVTSDDVRLNY